MNADDPLAVRSMADVPWPGTCFNPGEPVMTLMAAGADLAECRSRMISSSKRGQSGWESSMTNGPWVRSRQHSGVEVTTMLLTYEYFLFAIPGMALSMWAQARISRAYAEGSRIPARAGVTGAEAASMVMRTGGATGVTIEPVEGELSDHYDPRNKVLATLSGRVWQSFARGGRNRRPRGRACHSRRLALSRPGRPQPDRADGQHRLDALLGPCHGWAHAGLDEADRAGNHPLFADGRLPARQPARRIRRQPPRPADPSVTGLISPDEDQVVAKVLNAAAWTYVAATLTSVMQLLYFLAQYHAVGDRRRQG